MYQLTECQRAYATASYNNGVNHIDMDFECFDWPEEDRQLAYQNEFYSVLYSARTF